MAEDGKERIPLMHAGIRRQDLLSLLLSRPDLLHEAIQMLAREDHWTRKTFSDRFRGNDEKTRDLVSLIHAAAFNAGDSDG